MRGIVGLTLTGLGAFCVALALLLHFYVTGQVIKFPLNESSITSFTGSDVSYFAARQLTLVTGVRAQATQVIVGDVEAGSASTAVWQEVTSIRDLTNFRTISTTERRSAFNRRTGALVRGYGEFVGSSTAVRQSGQGYVWPIGTRKQTYQVFDPVTLRAEPFRYSGTAPVDGILADKFVEQVNSQQFGTITLPGRLVGASTQARIKAPEYVTETTSVWVDPVSGIPVYEVQSQDETVKYAGTTALVLFQGTLSETSASAASAVATARSFDFREQLLAEIAPLIGLLLGALLLAVGIVAAWKRPQTEVSGYRSDEPAGLPKEVAESGYEQRRVRQNGHAPGFREAEPATAEPAMAEPAMAEPAAADPAAADPAMAEPAMAEPAAAEPAAAGLAAAGRQARLPGDGYPRWLPETGYQPASSQRPRYQRWLPEGGSARVRPQPAGSDRRPSADDAETEELPQLRGAPELRGRRNDGVERILEPRAGKPGVGGGGRGGRYRTQGW